MANEGSAAREAPRAAFDEQAIAHRSDTGLATIPSLQTDVGYVGVLRPALVRCGSAVADDGLTGFSPVGPSGVETLVEMPPPWSPYWDSP
jgi:hypothetical protein